ncbi:MAG: adenine deaminase [Paludibacter sp.]|nr:adenine deaminase [Paludibacter sp.]
MHEKISGNIVDVIARKITKGVLTIDNGKIISIEPCENVENQFIIPGFIDAHIHIESSMMLPAEFARHALVHGTVACVCDPHEIANVCGVPGVDYMIANGKMSPMKFYFGAPSCVPATNFDSAGAVLDAGQVDELLARSDIYFLSEMMNYPGVIENDEQVYLKLKAAHKHNKPIDGHAPELAGEGLMAYIAGGITTDHECMTISEAEAKIALGMKIQIREGSAAKNFNDLLPLLENNADKIMFCTDDKHPDDLIKNGHINALARRAVAKGYDPIEVLRICSYNVIEHYKLDVGMLQAGDEADFVVVNNLRDFGIIQTYIGGKKVAENGVPLFERYIPTELINNFTATKITAEQIKVEPAGDKLKVIMVDDGQLFTHSMLVNPTIENGNLISDIDNDVLKLVVFNRYREARPAVGFIKNIGLKRGALASTVSHDSHNIVAVGTSDDEIVSAINHIIDSQGGILACHNDNVWLLPLPVAGLMSTDEGSVIAKQYEQIDAMVKQMGSTLRAPFMTVAFMSLLVIPKLKLSDKGLFDGRTYSFTNLMENTIEA